MKHGYLTKLQYFSFFSVVLNNWNYDTVFTIFVSRWIFFLEILCKMSLFSFRFLLSISLSAIWYQWGIWSATPAKEIPSWYVMGQFQVYSWTILTKLQVYYHFKLFTFPSHHMFICLHILMHRQQRFCWLSKSMCFRLNQICWLRIILTQLELLTYMCMHIIEETIFCINYTDFCLITW